MSIEDTGMEWSARAFLFPSSAGEPVATLAATLDGQGVIGKTVAKSLPGKFSRVAATAVAQEVHEAADGLLSVDLIDLMVGGWRTYAALTSAAERTLARPGSEEVVDVVTHRVTSKQQPYVDLFVDGVHVGTVHLELTAVFTVHALVALVMQGYLRGVRGGICDLDVTLSAEGITVASRHDQLDLRMARHFRRPIPLLGVSPTDAPQPAKPSAMSAQNAGQIPASPS